MFVNRKAAREAGDRFYLPDRQCRNGHNSPRYVSTGHCSACLAAARGADQQLHAQAMAARFDGVQLFSYRLHPEDHAAALAYCQALDMQRGRTPSTGPSVAANSAAQAIAQNRITETRAELIAQAGRDAARSNRLSPEMAATLRAYGIPTNGS